MALTEKDRERIREEETLRLEVRRQHCSGGRWGHGRWKGFWLGLAAGLLACWLITGAWCGRHSMMGGGGKACGHHGMGMGQGMGMGMGGQQAPQDDAAK